MRYISRCLNVEKDLKMISIPIWHMTDSIVRDPCGASEVNGMELERLHSQVKSCAVVVIFSKQHMSLH